MRSELLLLNILFIFILTGISSAAEPVVPKDRPLNIIFFGNSFTKSFKIPFIVADIAKAAGHAAPQIQMTVDEGRSLSWHLWGKIKTIESPNDLPDISKEFKWDYVVLQEHSTKPTDVKIPKNKNSGCPNDFRKDVLQMVEKVKKHSPNAKAILYLTWARNENYAGFYPDLFKTPLDFQQQLNKYYLLATEDINKKYGKGSAILAPAGKGWEKLSFDKQLYAKDLYHPSAQGALLNAMIIYRAIYGGTVFQIDLNELCKLLEISSDDCKKLAKVADSAEITY